MALYGYTTSLSTTQSLPSPAKTQIPAVNSTLLPSLCLRFPKPTPRNAVVLRPRATAPFRRQYSYPDPIPEFAESETRKFRAELAKRLLKEKEIFGDELDDVIEVCAEIFRQFMHSEYGGPGTLLVEPFTDMMVALKDRNLPGAAFAARQSLLWAQNCVDQDWQIWICNSKV